MRGFYPSLVSGVRRRPGFCRLVIFLCKVLPWLFVLVFGITWLILMLSGNIKWIFFAVAPAISVLITTILRNRLDAPRPFERCRFCPLIAHKKGKSFPSRHTTSAFSIAFACFYISAAYGILLLCFAVLVAVSRILVGVHYIRDIVAGILVALAPALLCFALLSPIFNLT